MTFAQQLAALIRAPGCTVVPGAYDAWSARLVAQAGFSACYMTGFGVSASFLGAPDIGLTTATQMIDCATRMVDAAGIPIIADADTGYGNVLNVRHTVAAYRRAGVAAIQLEDQDLPKRCGHMAGKRVVEASEMVAKIKIAKDTAGEALLVVARTDSRSTHGLDEAIDRGCLFREAGADLVFIEAPLDREEMETICRRVPGVPLLAQYRGRGQDPLPGRPDSCGYRLFSCHLPVELPRRCNLCGKDRSRRTPDPRPSAQQSGGGLQRYVPDRWSRPLP